MEPDVADVSAPIEFERRRASPHLELGLLIAWVALLVAVIELPIWLAASEANSTIAAVTHHFGPGGPAFVPRGHPVADFVAPGALERVYLDALTPGAIAARVFGSVLLGVITGLGLHLALRRLGGRLRHRREVLTIFAWLAGSVVLARACLLWVPLAATWVPVAALMVPIALQLGRRLCFACALVLAAVVSALIPPFDPIVGATVAAQGIALSLVLPRRRSAGWRWTGGVALGCALAGTLAYLATTLLVHGGLGPLDLVSVEWGRLGWTVIGGLVWPFVGLALDPVLERAVGNVSRATLLELSDLNNPMLQRISSRSPGTWAHSRAMANLAESAAHVVGADALLVRVGAYYHDLGKADEPQYFIENLPRGQSSPHDTLAPEHSAQKIIHHVRSSVVRGRAAGLPEPIIDFMHTHHGDGRVEFFLQKSRAAAENPDAVDLSRFTYPGTRPFTPETGILMIVDSVEAASRTLSEPGRKQVDNLLRQIVFSKLCAGQLDDSGLTLADLRRIIANLTDSLLAAAHERITYPWQEEEKIAARAEAGMTEPSGTVDLSATPPATPEAGQTLRVIGEPSRPTDDPP